MLITTLPSCASATTPPGVLSKKLKFNIEIRKHTQRVKKLIKRVKYYSDKEKLKKLGLIIMRGDQIETFRKYIF